MTAKHTPGPWRHRKHNGQHIIDSTAQYNVPVYVAVITGVAPSQGDDEANARLIAAAPELLKELKQLVERFDCEQFTSICELDAAKDAIAKAEGGDA